MFMNDGGCFISGIYCGCDEKYVERNGVHILNYYYLLVNGIDSFKIRSEHDYRPTLKFGDAVDFKVRINAFNGQVYFSGDLWSDGTLED